MHTLFVLLDKEFRQFLRNPFMPKMTIAFPVMIMLVMPWVTSMDVRHIGVAVVDRGHSETSRRLAQKIANSDYFTLFALSDDFRGQLRNLEAGNVDAILELPDGFERDLESGSPQHVSISANGVNAMKGSLGTQYLMQTLSLTLAELSAERGRPSPADRVAVQYRYNPTLEYRNYMIPALMIMLLVMMCGFLPALNLVGEKESGTIEQINVTPVSQFVFTLAKLIPYWLIGLAVLTVAMTIGWLVYGLVPVGSLGSIYLAAALFILVMSGFGVIAANCSSNMQQTMFGMFFFVMIFILMSGLLTPIQSMPQWAQRITYALPPRYFIDIMRAVYLKGATVANMWPCYAALAGFAIVFNATAALTFRKQS